MGPSTKNVVTCVPQGSNCGGPKFGEGMKTWHKTEGKVIQIEDHMPVWENGKFKCRQCGYGCITTVHKDALKTKLECPDCGAFNSQYERVDE